MSSGLYSIRGMNDLFPDRARLWDYLLGLTARVCGEFCYDRIDFPIVGPTALFCRAIGSDTDIVEKEMYSFTDNLNGDKLALRPEGTACCLRAVAENNMTYGRQQRLWYHGPMFRHERPQKGRYRQFHQIGIECFGMSHEYTELEILLLNSELWRCLGIGDSLELHVNTIGTLEERRLYRRVLVDYFSSHIDSLDDDSRRRLYSNPFRILDTKNKGMQSIVSNAPTFFKMLTTETQDRYHEFLSTLTETGIPYIWNNRLVRGLDYYNGVVFEWVSNQLGSQSAVCAGGRYDGLAKQLGYSNIYAVGCAIGIERIVELCSDKILPGGAIRLYAAHVGIEAFYKLHSLARDLRLAGWSVIVHPGVDPLGAQIKRADQFGCSAVLIIGESELKEASVCIKFLASGQQVKICFEKLQQFLIDSLKG
ncbi:MULTISPECIES: histidine--tRNA ligase [Candidatus Ichthyocystis]|uniref:histidine--tRNA ligase n=1 Tax=Candidatus Ichthyocystis TaxID=2929841 RepID=UPI000A43F757|nr:MULTISPECIES: histidine--tRNA ligase [Ichthyocystis]